MLGCAMCTLPFSTQHDDMLAMLVCATRWLSMLLYTLAYMSMHESCLLVCRPCFNTMKLQTSDPNLHLSLTDTTLVCLLSCFVSLFACILVSIFAMSIIHGLYAGFLSLPLHVHTWSKDAWSQGTVSQAQAKRARMQACDISQATIFSRFKGLASPIWLCILLNPLPSSLLSRLDGCIRYIMPCTIRPHLQIMATLVYVPTPIFSVILQGCRHLLSCSVCLHCA